MISRSMKQLIILVVCTVIVIVVLTRCYLMIRPPYHSEIDRDGTTETIAVLQNNINDGNVDKPLVQDRASEEPEIKGFAPWEEDIQNRLSSVYFSIIVKSTESHKFSRLPPSVLTWLRTVPSRNVCCYSWPQCTMISSATCTINSDPCAGVCGCRNGRHF